MLAMGGGWTRAVGDCGESLDGDVRVTKFCPATGEKRLWPIGTREGERPGAGNLRRTHVICLLAERPRYSFCCRSRTSDAERRASQ